MSAEKRTIEKRSADNGSTSTAERLKSSAVKYVVPSIVDAVKSNLQAPDAKTLELMLQGISYFTQAGLEHLQYKNEEKIWREAEAEAEKDLAQRFQREKECYEEFKYFLNLVQDCIKPPVKHPQKKILAIKPMPDNLKSVAQRERERQEVEAQKKYQSDLDICKKEYIWGDKDASIQGANVRKWWIHKIEKEEKLFPLDEQGWPDLRWLEKFAPVQTLGNLLEGANLWQCNLSDMNLSDMNLHGVTLNSSLLEGTLLANAKLSRALLQGTNCTRANFTNTNIIQIDLTGADLSDIVCGIVGDKPIEERLLFGEALISYIKERQGKVDGISVTNKLPRFLVLEDHQNISTLIPSEPVKEDEECKVTWFATGVIRPQYLEEILHEEKPKPASSHVEALQSPHSAHKSDKSPGNL